MFKNKVVCQPCVNDDKHKVPPSWLLDKLADEKLSGGYNTKRSNVCVSCFVARSSNDTCMCS